MATSKSDLNRREALRRIALGAAATPIWVESLSALARDHAHTAAARDAVGAQQWTPKILSPQQNETVIALTELIIPATDTPGARAASVNRFVDWVLSEAPDSQRDTFTKGLAWLDRRSRARYKKDFAEATVAEQTTLLTPLSEAASSTTPPSAEDSPGVALFQAIKSMTISGYYATEIGLRQELGDDGQMFIPVFKGCDHPEHQ